MNLLRGEQFDPCLLSSIQEDLLIMKILRIHDPNDRYKIDARQLLHVVESTMHCISPKVIYMYIYSFLMSKLSSFVYVLYSCIFDLDYSTV